MPGSETYQLVPKNPIPRNTRILITYHVSRITYLATMAAAAVHSHAPVLSCLPATSTQSTLIIMPEVRPP
jgi:hypothetical protein